MSKALEIAAQLKNKYYCVNTIHGLQSDIENAVEILRSQDDDINRLCTLNAELVEVCQRIVNLGACPSDIAIMSRLIAKAKEQS
jgi:hypothetical protein